MTKGVSHLDDLIYLFNNTAYYPSTAFKVGDEEYNMAKLMTGIWANFATHGYENTNGNCV